MGRLVLPALLLMFLSACSATDILNALVAPGGFATVGDIAYGSAARQRLDLYRPATAARPAPVVVFFYGGGWDSGDRAMYRFVGAALASRGYLTIIPDYRLYPAVRFPAFLEDAAAATAWALDHAAREGGDPHRLFLVGHSAGAYLASMLCLDPKWLGAVGMVPGRDIRAMVGLAGPYDFLPLREAKLQDIFGPADGLARTQPINFVAPGAPPMLLVTGTGDDTVDPANSTRLAARLRGAGDPVEEIVYPGVGHRMLIGAFAGPLRFAAPTLRDVVRYLDRMAAGPGGA